MSIEPRFLTVPKLYEESTATISWENIEAAQGYELDIMFNESFDSASKGKRWSDILAKEYSWGSQDEATGLCWEDIENLDAQGLMWRSLEFKDMSWEDINLNTDITWKYIQERPVNYTIYKGMGRDIPAPDQGLTWSDYERADSSWNDKPSKSWQEFSEIASVGLEWKQHERKQLSWEDSEKTYQSWLDIEELAPYGLTWLSMNARWFSWDSIHELGEQEDGLTWEDIENLPADNKTHKGHVVGTPLYTKASMLRVRGFDKEGNATPYKTTALVKHNPRSLKKYKLPCLHIPELHEGRNAEIVWGDLYGASEYILERKYGSDFEKCYDGSGYKVLHPNGCLMPKALHYEPDCKQHLACTNKIPYYQKNMTYRIKGYNTTDHSQYIESLSIPIIPVFYREGTTSFSAVKDESYFIHIQAERIRDFENILMSLGYSANQFVIEEITNKAADYKICEPVLGNNKIEFRCNKFIPENSEWSGLIMLLRVKALRTETINITLS